MSELFSRALRAVTKVIAPPSGVSLIEQATHFWHQICNCTLNNSLESLNLAKNGLNQLINIIKEIQETEGNDGADDFLRSHQVPLLLSNFAKENIPNGFSDEVLLFFVEFTSEQLSYFLKHDYFIRPLNGLLERCLNSVEDEKVKLLFNSLLSYLVVHQNDINLFIVSDTSAPLISYMSTKFFQGYNENSDFIFNILTSAKINDTLHNFILNHSQLAQNSISFIYNCIESKTIDPSKQKILSFIDISLSCSPPDYVALFCSIFDEQIIRHFINDNPIYSLSNIIYMLSSFSSKEIISMIIEIIDKNMIKYLEQKDENVVFLTTRCITLLFEFIHPQIVENSQPSKIFIDFISLVPTEWYIEPELETFLQDARSKINMSYSIENTIMIHSDIKLTPIIIYLLKYFEDFLDNSPRINLALTDLFSIIASLPGSNASYFSFCENCETGLVKSIKAICLTAQRRVGNKENTIEQIKESYNQIKFTQENKLFCNIAILLNFLKEITAISQSKSVLHQHNSLFIS